MRRIPDNDAEAVLVFADRLYNYQPGHETRAEIASTVWRAVSGGQPEPQAWTLVAGDCAVLEVDWSRGDPPPFTDHGTPTDRRHMELWGGSESGAEDWRLYSSTGDDS